MTERFLTGKMIAFSISESTDLLRLGMSPRALDHAVIEIARYLLRAGAQIAYGGDLRKNGFTLQLIELVRRYRRDDPDTPPLHNYLTWSKHSVYPPGFLDEKAREYAGAARIIPLDPYGEPMTSGEAPRADSITSMTGMRTRVSNDCDARIVIGGKVNDFSGRCPGLMEEAALTLERDKPVVLIGGFGGSTRDMCSAIGFGKEWIRDDADVKPDFKECYEYGKSLVVEAASKHREALPSQNEILADSRNLPEIIRQTLAGLHSVG